MGTSRAREHCGHVSPLTLKIADFGLARTLPAVGDEDGAGLDIPLSGAAFTRYYRPIEVLLGSRSYGTAADVWSASCTCGEMCLGAPIFPGNNSSQVMVKVVREVGIPSASRWPALAAMPLFSYLTRVANQEQLPRDGCFVEIRKCASAIGDSIGDK